MNLLANLFILAIIFEKSFCAMNMIFTNWTQCDNAPIKFHLSFRMLNATYQLINMDYSSPVVNGDKFRLTFDAEYSRAKSWIHILQIKEENGICKAMIRYGGEFYKDILRRAGLPTSCPLPIGNYHLKNYRMKFDQLKLKSFPQGKLRLHFRVYEKSTEKLSMCMDTELLNKPLF